MSDPTTIAREIVKQHPREQDLIAHITSALAASEQRRNVIDAQYASAATSYQADITDLRAQLQASERALGRVIDGTSHLVCPHDSHTLGCLCACKGCTRRRLALTSPGSPQEKGT
jgi:hypothetical protein